MPSVGMVVVVVGATVVVVVVVVVVVGAIVDVHTKGGSVIRHRVRRDGGYAADTPPLLLCPNPASVVKLEIRWSNGDKELIPGPLQPGQQLISKEPALN